MQQLPRLVDPVAIRQSDTDVVRHDTGAFGSTGTVVAAEHLGVDRAGPRLVEDAVEHRGSGLLLNELHQAAAGRTPRSVAFNAQWFRIAVDPDTANRASCAACTRPTRAR